MSKIKHIFDTLTIGVGIIAVKEGFDYLDGAMFDSIYSAVVEGSGKIYELSLSGIDYLHFIPNNELMVGFGIGVISNLAAGFIKSEYGSITNLIRREKLKEESIYSKFR